MEPVRKRTCGEVMHKIRWQGSKAQRARLWLDDRWFCWGCDKMVLPGQEHVTYVDTWCGRFCIKCNEEYGIC